MMPRPIVAVVSDDDLFVSQLATELGEAVELIARPGCSEILQQMQETPPQVLMVDARTVDCGGHSIVRFLDAAMQQTDSMRCIVLSSAECPEPLERRIACSQIEHVRDPVDVAELARRVVEQRCTTPGRAAPSAECSSENDVESDAAVARSGVTRRLETKSAPLKVMPDDLTIAADHDGTILLLGETGSGNTFLSRLIHEASSRRDEPFLHIACGALPRELIESVLFGHAKGAFTSAHADQEGKFVAARKGTMLLDEIDVLGPEQQVKLLRVIETGEFEPVGSNQTLRSQARLVVASNLDLQPLVDQGRFRPDLYYRLNMLKFEIPPLRKRRIDIVPLAKQFIRKFQEKHGISIVRVEDSLLDALAGYPWPGNVRELENVIQRAVIYCRDGVLTARQLPDHIVAGAAGPTNDPSVRLDGYREAEKQTLGRQIAMTEREIIEQALFQNDRSKTRTAKALGISRVTLYNKLKKLEIDLRLLGVFVLSKFGLWPLFCGLFVWCCRSLESAENWTFSRRVSDCVFWAWVCLWGCLKPFRSGLPLGMGTGTHRLSGPSQSEAVVVALDEPLCS